MPELPEVQTVVTTLRPRLLGRRISRVSLGRTDILTPPDADLPRLLAGRTFTDVHRRAKRIMFTLDDGSAWYIHLGMTGRLTLDPRDADLPPHTHLLLDLADAPEQLRFRDPRRFGGVWWLGHDTADNIGPEPLTLRSAQLARRLSRTTRAIKNALLDQTVIAGLGNIYVDESLFAAGLHPLLPANEISPADVAKLNRAIKATLRRALTHRGSTLRDYRDANGAPGDFQKLHRVYDREDKPCARCRSPIQRIVTGGRSTHFCEKCQPARSH